jgi:hypothetical protein
LVQALRQEGLPGVETAYTRVVSLLQAAASREQGIQPALRLRLLWLRAWLSVELGEVAATPAFTDEILVLVD